MNDELKDYKLKSSESDTRVETGGGKKPIWPYLIVVALIVAGVIFFLRRGDETGSDSEPAIEQPTESAPLVEEETETDLIIGEVPAIGESDSWLREIARQLSTHPDLAQWLLSEELIRAFVVVVDNVAEGTPPSGHLEFMAPEDGFRVRQSGGETTIDPASYHRFDGVVDVIESIDTEGAGKLYRAIQPMLQQAYEDLGYPGQSFDVALGRAVQRLLAVPVVEGPIVVDAKIAAYKYHDKNLEDLSPVAKQFLRLGSDNLIRLQAKVRALARAAGISTG
jgi:hypothetical protein